MYAIRSYYADSDTDMYEIILDEFAHRNNHKGRDRKSLAKISEHRLKLRNDEKENNCDDQNGDPDNSYNFV